MKPLLFSFFLIALPLGLKAQTCNCAKEIQTIANNLERNLASYQHQVVEYKRTNEYLQHKEYVLNLAKKTKVQKECIGILAIYLAFIRDEHLYLMYQSAFLPYKSSADTLAIRKFYESDEIVQVNKGKQNQLTGKWYFEGTNFGVEIVKSKNVYREYAALTIQDNALFWRKGNVKFEIVKTKKGGLACVYWSANRIPKYYPIEIKKDVLHIGRSFKFDRKPTAPAGAAPKSNGLIEFKTLNENTTYLRIQSFDLSYQKAIDSTIAAHKNSILQKPNFIIDIRNNGGGGFDAFQSLLPFVLDNNSINEPYSASVWVSDDNFNFYDETKYDYAETQEDSIAELGYVTELKEYLGKFTPTDFNKISADTLYQKPLKIAVLTNQFTASTAEGFALIAKNSKRVKHFGDYTTGAITYGDIRMVEFPSLNIEVGMTTKKMTFSDNIDIESIGIKPDIIFNKTNEKDWIDKVIAALKN
jgi:hypothetical protein